MYAAALARALGAEAPPPWKTRTRARGGDVFCADLRALGPVETARLRAVDADGTFVMRSWTARLRGEGRGWWHAHMGLPGSGRDERPEYLPGADLERRRKGLKRKRDEDDAAPAPGRDPPPDVPAEWVHELDLSPLEARACAVAVAAIATLQGEHTPGNLRTVCVREDAPEGARGALRLVVDGFQSITSADEAALRGVSCVRCVWLDLGAGLLRVRVTRR